ncbi:hydroxylase accessory protein YqeC [Desulfosporosinus meridiei]|uniref:Selenium-dependent hydroxylase accessory protein YqeC n=1 Tax=Desulfosporosinus meridiei (strain ATCC BAA-275 / DSM 13257 / KCTC 12902 / NCIMB 13706 / S10) TaxID=768704 RepID=G6G9T2_DESMD|nr:hydroxylase accessory protein YqeC [Desulfosporosinus meridiei]AFQ43314.1 hypothetical protein Desmer_1303 [Desulfosporosinus meridiei DSM 13257]
MSSSRLTAGLKTESGSLWNMTRKSPVTTFIGAGGKTTCVRSLTREILSAGLQVVATTTTKVYPENQMSAWKSPGPPPPNEKGAWFWYDRTEEESGKWIGPSLKAVDEAIAEDLLTSEQQSSQAGVQCGSEGLIKPYWVIEGDGARERKLKCWETYEPQIPKQTDCAVLMLDRGLWGNVLQVDQVHRPHLCQDLLGKVWNAESAWSYFLRSPVFASQYREMSWVILLNGPGKIIENKQVIDPIDPVDLLLALKDRWEEMQGNLNTDSECEEKRPCNLRIAVGDAKEGELRWFDLW